MTRKELIIQLQELGDDETEVNLSCCDTILSNIESITFEGDDGSIVIKEGDEI